MPSQFSQPSGSGIKDKSDRDARWISDFTDELAVAIALQQWDEAIELIDRGIGLLLFLLSALIEHLFAVFV